MPFEMDKLEIIKYRYFYLTIQKKLIGGFLSIIPYYRYATLINTHSLTP
jgi:hypothetical protein